MTPADRTEAERLTDGYEEYLHRFNRMEYEAAFANYKAAHMPFFSSVGPDGAGAAADDVLRRTEALIRFPRSRKLVLIDMQRFLSLYLVPAALASGIPEAAAFAALLRERWNERYPDHRFGACIYEELEAGFRDKRPFGLG